MSTKIPKTFKSVIYSTHSVEDCASVLSIHEYTPKEDLSKSIVLKSLAFPINPSDINQLQGVYPSLPPKTLEYSTNEPAAIAGNEGVFEVVSIPPEMNTNSINDLNEGDWVIPLYANQGTWSNYRVFKDPKELVRVNGLDLYTAATVAVNGVTAYQLVKNFISWDIESTGNEWLIQNAGTSGVSKMVTQIAKINGIKTLSVIRDRDDFDEVAETLEKTFGATKVISESQNNDKVFNKEVLPKILGENARVRLALNSVGGKSSSSIARKLENDALMLTYGGMSKQPVTLPTSLHIFKGLTSQGYWSTKHNKENPSQKIDAIDAIVDMYKEGDFISPKNELDILEWDVNNASDTEVLDMIKYGITGKGKKRLIKLNW
ncbi:enoyl-[acyl-carrier-protein] reductase NDAI_0A07200 [Naumovozyma dairenensis CBS 421]|uniref:Uncharacterized protein n=1 Tax=Naumovozyma dairenensis (strain ATCC 10597 / BCRC 20456 / CBS 421 / NBRC 0211 / NRRL Y-12639) TaxID=1071378 RepID=G0W4Y6_NAUDC|nr:hypothetical protein NDAI_0A07200 [Naumovozyma dairenensis CBS 421]CCD22874.1 hypothetical protein NDAI_0A07200 [Naumovozyma dairenensis CBS 421]